MKVLSVDPDSPAERAGISAGDNILSVKSFPAIDALDIIAHDGCSDLKLTVERGCRQKTVYLRPAPGEDYGLTVEEFRWRSCGNRCVFCYVDQLPPGLRESLYFKDEDYRLSFLTGSYVTLTNIRNSDIERIIRLNLSPLRVSVHASDPLIRQKLLGLQGDDRLFEKILRLKHGGIIIHAQVVVCPGLNDGKILAKTIEDLASLWPSVSSVAIVPVGLTKYRKGLYQLEPVDKRKAGATLDIVDRMHRSQRKRTGVGFVYASDEMFLKAGIEVPEASYYDDFPQWEDGVGMVRTLLDEYDKAWRTIVKKLKKKVHITIVTGASAAPILRNLVQHNPVEKLQLQVIEVENKLFGPSVTVSGLLAGADILAALEGSPREGIYLLPPRVLNADGLFLDDMTLEDLRARSGFGIRVSEDSLVESLMRCFG